MFALRNRLLLGSQRRFASSLTSFESSSTSRIILSAGRTTPNAPFRISSLQVQQQQRQQQKQHESFQFLYSPSSLIKNITNFEGNLLNINNNKKIEDANKVEEMKLDSVKRKRKLKMKKHKLRKRRKAQRSLKIKLKK
ncbi:hypothetical protein PACTADRAFT_47445 [Pachysolen tannophilus NRRL Y-2460]|uniref:Ribosomal protein mS38 C-terminal domain-containing protein n=1 Tax=Pachysolen tannophilus NRRL Y-2460 TaxID=669874 RepID=A0A1E4U0J6_PACTA|nr:hypothetical protein PACTADRAFT_47445 [Pachysolen tannophilus NRRL Y-2460]